MEEFRETIPFYRGHEGFQEVIKNPRLSRPGRAIRVYNYAGPSNNEKLYVIGTNNQLFDSSTGNIVNPNKVLSRKYAPDGWSVEGLEISLLPESEIEKLIKNNLI